MNKIKKYITDIPLLTTFAFVLLAISYAPVSDNLKLLMLHIKYFIHIVITIILIIAYIRMRKIAKRMGVRIIFTFLFLAAFISGIFTIYKTFIKILNNIG